MEKMKVFLAALLVSTMIFLGHAAVSFAHVRGMQNIQMLKDSASALKASNPDLSAGLSRFADEESGEKEEDEENEASENSGAVNVKLLKDSAAALKPSNPLLADALTLYAEQEAREEKE